MSPETEGRIPENLIPENVKGNALWEWLKNVLRKAAAKFADKDADKNDPDKETGSKVLKSLKGIAKKIKEEQVQAAANGEKPVGEFAKHLPPHLLDVVDAINVDGFIGKHEGKIIDLLSAAASGYLGADKTIIRIGMLVLHESGVDKALVKKIAPKIREQVLAAISRVKLQHREGTTDFDDAHQFEQQFENFVHEPAPRAESPQPSQEKDQREKQRGSGLARDEQSLRERLEGRMPPKDMEWFDALDSAEEFSTRFAARIDALVGKPRKNHPGEVYSRIQAEQAVSDEVTEFVMNSLITIYSPILDEEPKESFDRQAQNAGNQFDNPFSAARTFSKMLNSLREKSTIAMMGTGEAKSLIEKDQYHRLAREMVVVKDDTTGQLVERVLPSTNKQLVGIGEFAEYLREVFDTAEDTMDYGHNFKLLTNLGPREGPKGTEPFFAQIKEHAKRFSADKIDTAFRLPYNDVVQAAKQKFQSSYARMFVDNQWQKDPSMLGRFLQSMPAAERRVKEELREQFKGEDVPDWAIEWAFQAGRTMYFGLDFGFHEMVSYADPNLQYNGKASLTGLGGMRGYFDMWEGAKMLNFKKDLICAGAVWLPYTINFSETQPYDHAQWRKLGEERWKQSFGMGQAAYAGTFLDGERLFIDMGNYLHTGGWGTNQGWRVREGYNSWLLPEFKGGTLNNLDPKGDVDLFVRSWKRIENVGIPITENFWQQQVINKADEGAIKKPEFVEAVKKLGEFFFDRYFSDGAGNLTEIGKELLKEYPSKHEFVHHIEHALTSEKHKGSRQENLQSIINKVLTVLTIEQMPAHLVTMEKQRMTEYGVTLLSEIQADFLPDPKNASTDQLLAVKKQVDTALANLVYSQEKLRIDASRSMDDNLANGQSLYGDLSKRTSSILGGQGNRLTQEYVVKALEERFGLAAGTGMSDSRIADVVKLYVKIQNRIVATPNLSDVRKNVVIDKLFVDVDKVDAKGKSARTKSKKERDEKEQALVDRVESIEDKAQNGKFRSRVAWWAHALDSNYFGHSVTQPSVAMKFINVAAAGPDIVSRDADQAANTSELMHTQTQVLYREGLKKGAEAAKAKGAHEGFVPLEEWIGTFKGKIQGELSSEPAYEMSFRMAQLINYFYKKDDEANKWWKLGPQRYWANMKKSSLSDNLIDEGAPLWSWDHDTEHAWAEHLHHNGKLKKKAARGEKHKIVEKKDLVHKILKQIPYIKNKFKYTKEVHDHANTFSYHALFEWSESGYGKLAVYHYLPALMALLVTLGVLAAKEGSKDMNTSGGGGGGGGKGGHGGHH